MKEIKFRAWQTNHKEMYEHPFGYIEFYKDKNVVGFDDGDLRLEGDDVVLMQFTGLHDKNGKEIYEGDILQRFVEETEVYTGEQKMTVDNMCSCYSTLRDLVIDKKPFTVIGNIYENQDLNK